MAQKEDKTWMWVKRIGMVLGVLIGLGTLGFVMPWDAASKQEVKVVKEKVQENREDIAKMDGKLDTIIEMLRGE